MHLWQECKEVFEVELLLLTQEFGDHGMPRCALSQGYKARDWANIWLSQEQQAILFSIIAQLKVWCNGACLGLAFIFMNSIWETALSLSNWWLRCVKGIMLTVGAYFSHFGLAWTEGLCQNCAAAEFIISGKLWIELWIVFHLILVIMLYMVGSFSNSINGRIISEFQMLVLIWHWYCF